MIVIARNQEITNLVLVYHLFSILGKKEKKERGAPYTTGRGVGYLPGEINGLTKKLQLLAAEFFAGNTAVRNELVHVLDALLSLKQLTRKG